MPIQATNIKQAHGAQGAVNTSAPADVRGARQTQVNADARAAFSESLKPKPMLFNVDTHQALRRVTHEAALSQVARLSTHTLDKHQNQSEPHRTGSSQPRDNDIEHSEYSLTDAHALPAALPAQTSPSVPTSAEKAGQENLPSTLSHRPTQSSQNLHDTSPRVAKPSSQMHTAMPATDIHAHTDRDAKQENTTVLPTLDARQHPRIDSTATTQTATTQTPTALTPTPPTQTPTVNGEAKNTDSLVDDPKPRQPSHDTPPRAAKPSPQMHTAMPATDTHAHTDRDAKQENKTVLPTLDARPTTQTPTVNGAAKNTGSLVDDPKPRQPSHSAPPQAAAPLPAASTPARGHTHIAPRPEQLTAQTLSASTVAAKQEAPLPGNNIAPADKSGPQAQSHGSEGLTREDISVIQHIILPTVDKLIQGQIAKAAHVANTEPAAQTKQATLAKAAASEALLDTRVKTQIHIQGIDNTRVHVELSHNTLNVNIATVAGNEGSFGGAALASLRDILEQKYPHLHIAIAFNVSAKDEFHQQLARDAEHSSQHAEGDDAQQHDEAKDQRHRPDIDDDLLGQWQ